MDRDIKNRILVADPDLRHQPPLIGTLLDRYHVATAASGAEVRKNLPVIQSPRIKPAFYHSILLNRPS